MKSGASNLKQREREREAEAREMGRMLRQQQQELDAGQRHGRAFIFIALAVHINGLIVQ